MLTIVELKQAPREQKFPFETVLLLRKVAIKRGRNDSEFLNVELGDRTGQIHVVLFENSPLYSRFQQLAEGTVLRVRGHTDYYDNRFSPKVTAVDVVTEEEANRYAGNLVESCPEDPALLWKECLAFVESLEHARLRDTVRHAFQEVGEAFQSTPGAISMHHAYRAGLLEHTVHMARAARVLLPLYREVHPDLAMAGILLHDIGKCLEYSGSLSARKTRAGILQGHVVLGYRIARRAAMLAKLEADLLERLEHIILSHQGNLEWGAAALAATPEAVFVSLVDNLDAKMGMVQAALRSSPESAAFSEFMPGLGAPLLVEPIFVAPEGKEENTVPNNPS